MKDIPIFILNKDRLSTLKLVIESLHKRNYTNITIIDDKSTYQPLLDWYKSSNIDIYFNTFQNTGNGTLYYLSHVHKIEKFLKPVMEGYYVFNDSDVEPINECPNDFIETLIEICKQYKKHKVGLGLKIDDIPDHFYDKSHVHAIEDQYWNSPILDNKTSLFKAPIDTTFAIYSPGSTATWAAGDVCLRTGHPYLARHIPWYYDYNNLPEDEKYYIMNLKANQGPCWSFWAKSVVK